MPIPVACACGQKFAAQDRLAGKTVKCPKCGHDLTETDFHQIKIDRCTTCHGVWFDAGEVEMLEHVDQSQIRSFVRSMFGLKW